MKVFWSDEARRNLIQIKDYIGLDSGQRAIQFVNKIQSKVLALVDKVINSHRVLEAEIGWSARREEGVPLCGITDERRCNPPDIGFPCGLGNFGL